MCGGGGARMGSVQLAVIVVRTAAKAVTPKGCSQCQQTDGKL